MIRDAKSRGDRFDERVALGPLLRSFLKYERNVAATAPYFHDGSAATLNEAVRQMGLAQLDRVLTDSQVGSIVAFLGTLTGTYRDRSVMPASAGPSPETVPR